MHPRSALLHKPLATIPSTTALHKSELDEASPPAPFGVVMSNNQLFALAPHNAFGAGVSDGGSFTPLLSLELAFATAGDIAAHGGRFAQLLSVVERAVPSVLPSLLLAGLDDVTLPFDDAGLSAGLRDLQDRLGTVLTPEVATAYRELALFDPATGRSLDYMTTTFAIAPAFQVSDQGGMSGGHTYALVDSARGGVEQLNITDRQFTPDAPFEQVLVEVVAAPSSMGALTDGFLHGFDDIAAGMLGGNFNVSLQTILDANDDSVQSYRWLATSTDESNHSSVAVHIRNNGS
jgi:hypothetical protein